MAEITKNDIGKEFILDNRPSSIVTVYDILPDDWIKVIYPDGSHKNIVRGRLTRKPEVEVPASIDDLLDYPVKATKVVIEVSGPDGTLVKTLEKEEALKWNAWMRELCFKASELGVNPPWLSLDWKISHKAP